MSTVFPVELRLVSENAKSLNSSTILQAFTRDISSGGMCLELKSFGQKTESAILSPRAKLSLTINTAFSKSPIQAIAEIVWLEKSDDQPITQYMIGISYLQIDPVAQKKIVGYAQKLVWMPRMIILFGICLVTALGALYMHDQSMIRKNQELVTKLVEEAEKKSGTLFNLYDTQKEKIALEQDLAKARDQIEQLQKSFLSLEFANAEQKEKYEKDLADSKSKQVSLESAVAKLNEGKEKLQSEYQNLKRSDLVTDEKILLNLAGWLRAHQNLRTGLVASFEGDEALEDWAFSYDQSLVCQAFLVLGDNARAAQILSFFKDRAEKKDGAFFNAYHAGDGSAIESTVHCGPNIWIGIAALKYQMATKDAQFLGLAKGVADWAIGIQDEEGGLKGGPDFNWYSTEHNLDAYAFFTMMARVTGDAKYTGHADKTLAWIQKYAYTNKSGFVGRGKGDSTIATDTFAWSIAAIGPARLAQMGFDPEAIVQFAEDNCSVTVDYVQPSGHVDRARGFDFSRSDHLGRGGIISAEWTSQMIVAFQILADYYGVKGDKAKQDLYEEKAQAYSNELHKLMITSPSKTGQGQGCLPYASIDNADTGHGWRTPKGKRTGSLSSTSYALFSGKRYNPLGTDR